MISKQTFSAKIDNNGKIEFYDKTRVVMWTQLMRGKEIEVTLEKESNKRTIRQNNALHLYFELLAETLNEAGLDMRGVLKPSVDIEWTGDLVKNYLWRPIQIAQVKKKSTTDLNTDEIDKIYETLNRFLGERFKIHIPFPSIENEIFS